MTSIIHSLHRWQPTQADSSFRTAATCGWDSRSIHFLRMALRVNQPIAWLGRIR